MRSPNSSTKRASTGAEALLAGGPAQSDLRPDEAVRSLDEFIEFLEAVEAVTGPDDRPRPPTRGHRFLL
jgi:hypothetical protein